MTAHPEQHIDDAYLLQLVTEFRGEPFEIVALLQSEGWSRMAAIRAVNRACRQRDAQETCS